jgi:hypothetical protein
MKAFGLVCACVFSCALSSVALAAPPGTPHISVQATDIKQLEFTWTTVPGVQRYELWFRAVPGAPWVKYAEQDARRGPRFRIGVAVHLLDWQRANYYVKACNPSGCSSSNLVGVDGEQLVAMGYIKPIAATGHEFFGNSIALSADGKTLAVLTAETLGGRERSAVVHVYHRNNSISDWRREARLLPSTVQASTGHVFSGDPLALSADGNLLAFGLFRENMFATPGPAGSGAVYLFRRTGSTWALAQKLIAAQPHSADYFGTDVKVDDAGRTLVISHNFLTDRYEPGTLEVYRDPVDASDQFVHSATLPVPAEEEGYCYGGTALSGDGQTLLRGCRAPAYVQVFNGPDFSESARVVGSPDAFAITYDGTVFLVSMGLQTFAYRLTSSGWVLDADLTAPSGIINASQRRLAISRDGKIAALGNPWDFTAGLGPIFPPYQMAETQSGAVTVFERKSSGWVLRRWIKPGSTNDQWFGHAVALSDNGRVLAVGAPFDASAATGIDGDRDDDSMPERGAVWIY